MKEKARKITIYAIAILACIAASIEIGSEILAIYEMKSTGMESRVELGDDLGFGILLFMGLIPEVIIGLVGGTYLGKYINAKVSAI